MAETGMGVTTESSDSARTSSRTLLEVNDLTIQYGSDGPNPVQAVEEVSFSLGAGETLGLVGESGCGKTTAGLALLRALPPQGRILGGEILFDGVDIAQMGKSEAKRLQWKEIAMIYQGAMNAFNPVKTIGYQIREALSKHDIVPKNRRDERVRELLEKVNLDPGVAKQYPHQLSGGMKQRAAIAMAISCEPNLLIADEPTTALDVVVQGKVLQMLKDLQREFGFGMVVISHDLATIMKVSDEIGVMYAGQLVERTNVIELYDEPKHPYTARLFGGIIDPHRPPKQVEHIPGEPPDLRDPPTGCRFAPRCDLATEECHEADPPLDEVAEDHYASCFHSDEVRKR